MTANEPDARLPDVYRMNTSTGRKTLKSTEKPGDVVLWVADRKGAVRAAVEVDKGTTVRVFWRPDEHSKWVRLAEANHRDAMFIPVAFDGDGSLFVTSNIGRDTWAMYRYDTDKRAIGAEVAAHPQVDLKDGLIFDRRRTGSSVWVIRPIGPGSYGSTTVGATAKSIDDALPGRVNAMSRADTRRS